MSWVIGRGTNRGSIETFASVSADKHTRQKNWLRSYARPFFARSSLSTVTLGTPVISSPGLAS